MIAKIRIAILLVLVFPVFIHGDAFAGFTLRKSSSDGSSVQKMESRKVGDVEKEMINAILSGKTDGKENKQVKPSDDLVTGFGQDLPLVISLQQIVPSSYQFSLDKNVDANLLTSWEGGKDWRDVLEDMLGRYDLYFDLKDHQVIIKTKVAMKPIVKGRGKLAGRASARRNKKVELSLPSPDTVVIDHKNTKKKKRSEIKSRKEEAKTEEDQMAESSMTPVNILAKNIGSGTVLENIISMDQELGALINNESNPDWRMANTKWIGYKYQTLKEVLTEWCAKENVELYWTMDYDYKLNRNLSYTSEFEEAIATILDLFRGMRPQPYGQLHVGTTGALVLVVNSYDLSH